MMEASISRKRITILEREKLILKTGIQNNVHRLKIVVCLVDPI